MNAVRRRAWWVLLALGVVVALFGIGDTLIGVAFDPTIPLGVTGLTTAELEAASPAAYRMIDYGARAGGPTLALLGVLFSVIVVIPYRGGRRWAWIAMWGLPVWALSSLVLGLAYGLAPGQPLPPPMISGPVVAAIAALALLIDLGRFFRPAERAQA